MLEDILLTFFKWYRRQNFIIYKVNYVKELNVRKEKKLKEDWSNKKNSRIKNKKVKMEVCLLFWLKICSIISVYFRPILVLKFKLKSSVKRSAKTRGFLRLFILVFLLYSRAIISFSFSPSLFLCTFHCFNCWKSMKICLVKTLLV